MTAVSWPTFAGMMGGGYPVLFCHGTPGSRLFRPPDPALLTAIGVDLVTVDRPGSDARRVSLVDPLIDDRLVFFFLTLPRGAGSIFWSWPETAFKSARQRSRPARAGRPCVSTRQLASCPPPGAPQRAIESTAPAPSTCSGSSGGHNGSALRWTRSRRSSRSSVRAASHARMFAISCAGRLASRTSGSWR